MLSPDKPQLPMAPTVSRPGPITDQLAQPLLISAVGLCVRWSGLHPPVRHRDGRMSSETLEKGTPGMEPDRRSCSSSDAAGPGLSVVINTLNEERNIEDCLKSVQSVADEIVLVDMFSDDRTVDIARRYTDRIFFHERTGVVEPAREAALQQARGEWILVLDADERLSPELAAGLRDVIAEPGGVDVFTIPRRNFIAGRWMRGSGFGTDTERQPRLFRQGSLRWPNRIHAYPVILGTAAPLPLPVEARIDHLAYRDLREFVERLNRYTDHEARTLDDDRTAWTFERMISSARDEFNARYDPEADGVHSLVLATAMAFYRFLTWAKLWEKQGYPGACLPAASSDLFRPFSGPVRNEPRDEERREGAVTLVSGFHEDEGGWCWMSGEGKIRVSAAALPAELHFCLACGESRYYEHFPFQVQIIVGRRLAEKVFFEADDERREIRIPLEKRYSDIQIRIKSQELFVPAYLGLNRDRRRLSVRLSDLQLTEAACIGS